MAPFFTDPRDITRDMSNIIDEHTATLRNSLHYKCFSVVCLLQPVLKLAPVSTKSVGLVTNNVVSTSQQNVFMQRNVTTL